MAYHRAALVAARPPAWDAAAARRGWRDSGVALVGSRRGLSTTPKPKNELSEEERDGKRLPLDTEDPFSASRRRRSSVASMQSAVSKASKVLMELARD